MKLPEMAALRLPALLFLQGLWLAAAHGAEPGSPAFKEEMSKQDAIYQGKGEKRLEGYVIDRSLVAYSFTLAAEFDRALARLGPRDRWLDIGAGRGRAVLDYYTSRYDAMHAEGQEWRGAKASAVAMSIEDRRTAAWEETAASLPANKITYLSGRRLSEYSVEELGRFQVITDVIGGFSYTATLDRFMEKTLALLVLGGDFFTVLQDVHAENGTNKPYYEGAPYLTEITNADGSEVRVCSWLKSISCAQVTCELRTGWTPPIEVYHVKKICDDVRVPALERAHYAAGTPPERRFKLKNPPPVLPEAVR